MIYEISALIKAKQAEEEKIQDGKWDLLFVCAFRLFV